MTSKQAALIRFVWRVKENGRSQRLCFLDLWKSALGTSLSEDVRGCDVMITEDGKGGGHLVFLIGGRISRNSIDQKRYGCQDKRMEKQHGVNIMAVEVQIGWLWTWPGRRSWVREESRWRPGEVENRDGSKTSSIAVLELKSGFEPLQQSEKQSTEFRYHSFSIVFITAFAIGPALAYYIGWATKWILFLQVFATYLQSSLMILHYVVANTVLYLQCKTTDEGDVSSEYVRVIMNEDDGDVAHLVTKEEAGMGGFVYRRARKNTKLTPRVEQESSSKEDV
ncbi:hypothetical protein Tco_1376886 [Tanacetum coccineum]